MTSCCPEEQQGDERLDGVGPKRASEGLNPDFPIFGSDSAACCCGGSPQTQDPHQIPGCRLWPFVKDVVETPVGRVPLVRTDLLRCDRLGSVSARLGVGRSNYRIAPGLYGAGDPDHRSPVMVTANYKLSFDVLRSHLAGVDVWILVVNTNGINVWCAAGKGSFSTVAVADQVKAVGLGKLVSHRRLVLPQLSASGVAARQVKELCGFNVVWGPVHAKHLKAFIDDGLKATPAMRTVTFAWRERVELIPVELNHMGKPTLYLLPVLFGLSGIGPQLFSFHDAVARGAMALLAYLLAVFAGAVMTPALLPWLPGTAFALKGALVGVATAAVLSASFAQQLAVSEMLALTLLIVALSSYLAMNFTGSTPFTSPTGVEKEMRIAIPAQTIGVFLAAGVWVGTAWMKA
jgi:hypothetical protein